MTRKSPATYRHQAAIIDSKNRAENPHKQLSLHIPQPRRRNSPRRSLTSPIYNALPTAQIATVDKSLTTNGNGAAGDEEEEEAQSDSIDEDNICLVCVGKCTCNKTGQSVPVKQKSPPRPAERITRRLRLRATFPPQHESPPPESPSTKRRRPTKNPTAPQPEVNSHHTYSTRSHNVIVRDGRGRGKNDPEKLRKSTKAHEIIMEISDVDLDDAEEDDEDSDDDDESDDDDDIGDSGDDIDIEGEEERAIIAEESRRLRAYSVDGDDDDADDDADEEDEMDDEEEFFKGPVYQSSESSPDEDDELYQNDLYLDASFGQREDAKATPRRASNESDFVSTNNPILQALIEERVIREDVWQESEEDKLGWECFIDDTDVDMGEEWLQMQMEDESIRMGCGDTTDEEDFKLLGPPSPPPDNSNKKKKQKKPNNDGASQVITTAQQPPPLATWERDGDEITIIDRLPMTESPVRSPVQTIQTTFHISPNLLSIDEFFDSTLLTHKDEEASDSGSSSYTVTNIGTPRPRKDSNATNTSFNTDSLVTPATQIPNRKVPLGSYRRKVMLSERRLEAQEKSVFLKEWYTLQERRNLRKLTKSRNEWEPSSSPRQGRRREKLRTAQRDRNHHDGDTELSMQFIKRRRTSEGGSSASFMASLGVDFGDGSDEEEDYDEEDYESGVVNQVGERMVLEDDLELAQFIVPPPGGIDLSPLFGAVDARI